MGRPRALVTAPLRGSALEELRDIADVVFEPWIEHVPIKLYRSADFADKIRSERADIVVCEADSCKGPVLELPLIAIGCTRARPSNVDVDGATAAGIPVLRTPGRNADAVAEMTVALLMAVNRFVVAGDRDVRAGTMFGETLPYQRYRAWQVAGRTAGLVGFGAVARAAKWRLEGLGMTVIASDPYAADATHSLYDLLAASDVVSMHAAVTPETARMMGAGQFAAMRPGAIYLNTARATLHDTDALVATLESGHLGGAGLDHFEGEILPTDHPLTAMDNVVLTPHIGGATYDVESNQAAMVVADIKAVLAGERPVHCANPEVLE
ncbi:MAG: 3-phosphoglycerate dehydrogenase [Acidimicrobiaceae bacterium]|nr:3-phosphoglycerate dehydrogenase [Acidimicrobiaceae bacterium]MXZ66661.1 3-phosphoglycerate dehydrogenase [Acidimicrobiaceae bacterium]MYF34230.1 3-phosphoglycerate dehydrogenase [Acidimicrobiaceae bacterium]MYG77146.1 3-phosphoglycerate dehydrogenase [Acidimicrobiaceae bacterium]MYJ29766.1 3-phosphoglycerate dehydrogenase [Acidimicrobiaceae bacterium]